MDLFEYLDREKERIPKGQNPRDSRLAERTDPTRNGHA